MPVANAPTPRVAAVDALRGFDMFWIIGSGGLIKALEAFGGVQPAAFLAEQLEHVRWEGFHFEDLIFPLFVFLAGVSLVFAVAKTIASEGRATASRRVCLRALLLYGLGLLYYGGISNGWENVRWVGVLQRIAFAYWGAGLLFIWCEPRRLVVATIGLLVGYWVLLTWVPVPGAGAAGFAERQNLSDYLDRLYLPGRRYSGDHDPEGLLSNLPAVASCLLGVLAGLWLRTAQSPRRKVGALLLGGAGLLVLGWAWSPWFPVIKKIWTSSYVLIAGGWSALLLALFYYLIDVRGLQEWARPFIWIGLNPLTIYLAANVVDFSKLAARLTGGNVQKFLNSAIHPGVGDLLTTLVAMSFGVLLARFLYRRKIFLRV